MKNMKRLFALLLLPFLFIAHLHAQEGMWLLSQLDKLDFNKKGMQLAVSDIYSKDKPSLANAILQLGGGSASFCSPDGLVITNHHVAFGAVQRASSASSDYLTNGFLARTRTEEIRAPGYRARLMTDMKDVTDEVLSSAKGISDPGQKEKKINEKIAAMSEELTKGKEDMEASVVPMYNGKQYILFIYKVFKDVRIVYVPPMSIGNYGGETDNWMWPRHTGDFSFMRVYSAPDGSGRDYNTANVPYKPKVWLKVAKDPLKEGDLTFIMGYPGQTTRYRSSTSVFWNENYNYPFAVKNFHEIIDLLDAVTKNNHEGEIRVASLKKGLANVMKNYEGKLEGMKKTRFYEKKLAFEKEFNAWANSNPATKEKYGDILAKEKEQYKVLEKTKERDNVFSLFQGLSGTQLGIAFQALYFAQQRGKAQGERDPGFSEKVADETIESIPDSYQGYFEPADKALLVRALKMAQALPDGQRITGLDYILNDRSRPVEKFVDDATAKSKLNDPEYAKTLFKMTESQLKALNDPFVDLAMSIDPMAVDIQKVNETFAANVTDLRKVYLDGLYEWKGKGLYPDANSTIRFTSGPVKGYCPADAVWYDPFTTLQGVVDKNTGAEPFDAPAELVSLEKNKDFGRYMDPKLKDVPVAFLNQCDITGGNSGSPVMNAKGELIGLAFDGNYEAMIGDWQYDLKLQRTICVDIRYVLFITEKFSKADFILDEMGLSH